MRLNKLLLFLREPNKVYLKILTTSAIPFSIEAILRIFTISYLNEIQSLIQGIKIKLFYLKIKLM